MPIITQTQERSWPERIKDWAHISLVLIGFCALAGEALNWWYSPSVVRYSSESRIYDVDSFVPPQVKTFHRK